LEISAITIFERTRGMMQAAHRAQQAGDALKALRWHQRLQAYTDLWQSAAYLVHPLTGEAARIAATLLAVQPTPPPALYQPAKRRRGKRKQRRPEIRAAWERDVWIAATAISLGLPVATPNAKDFRAIAQLPPVSVALVVLQQVSFAGAVKSGYAYGVLRPGSALVV
jgi:hypothetical protein